MAKGKLDLAAAIAGMVSESNTGAPEVKMIALENIIPNPANFYVVDRNALQPLMDSIAMDGLHHYPLVMKHPDEEGKWQLIDGERRYTACKALVEEGNENFKTIPCTVKEYSSAALAELQLILSNSTNRVLSNAELAKQIQKTETLFYKLKEEGFDFPGRMRDRVAEACNVSATKIAKLKVIREGLLADFMYLFEKDKLPEQSAYALARMPVEFQSRLASAMGSQIPNGFALEKIQKEIEMGTTWDADKLVCPDGKACGGGNRFLRHDLDSPYNMCRGEKCCLECDNAKHEWYPCQRMCSKAKNALAEKHAAKKRTQEEELLFESEENKKASSENAKRLLKAIDAAGLDDGERIKWGPYGRSYTVGDIRKFAIGEFDENLLRDEVLNPEDLDNALNLAEQLDCSTDFLFGLTDDPNPVGMELEWRDPKKTPVVRREVVAKFTLPGLLKPKVMLATWNGIRWCFPSGAEIEAECTGWWPIPEVE